MLNPAGHGAITPFNPAQAISPAPANEKHASDKQGPREFETRPDSAGKPRDSRKTSAVRPGKFCFFYFRSFLNQ
jgi:hypothetical protein